MGSQPIFPFPQHLEATFSMEKGAQDLASLLPVVKVISHMAGFGVGPTLLQAL